MQLGARLLAFFLLFFPPFNLCNTPVPSVERGRERRGCQTEQLPLEWLGEVKAPTTLASRRPRLFWAVAASAAGMGVAFLYNEINRATHGFMPPLHKRSAHLDMPQLAFCPFWAAFRCLPFDAVASFPIVTPLPSQIQVGLNVHSTNPRWQDESSWNGDQPTQTPGQRCPLKRFPPANTHHYSKATLKKPF